MVSFREGGREGKEESVNAIKNNQFTILTFRERRQSILVKIVQYKKVYSFSKHTNFLLPGCFGKNDPVQFDGNSSVKQNSILSLPVEQILLCEKITTTKKKDRNQNRKTIFSCFAQVLQKNFSGRPIDFESRSVFQER